MSDRYDADVFVGDRCATPVPAALTAMANAIRVGDRLLDRLGR